MEFCGREDFYYFAQSLRENKTLWTLWMFRRDESGLEWVAGIIWRRFKREERVRIKATAELPGESNILPFPRLCFVSFPHSLCLLHNQYFLVSSSSLRLLYPSPSSFCSLFRFLNDLQKPRKWSNYVPPKRNQDGRILDIEKVLESLSLTETH